MLIFILVRTGLRAALAAEMVSFWIWRSDALFDRFSTAGFPSAVAGPKAAAAADEDVDDDVEEEDDEEAAAETADGSAVIRSMRVVPEESCAIHHQQQRIR